MRPALPRSAPAWRDPAARRRLAEKVSLLHCTTEYPCPPEDVNLAAMHAMRAAFRLPVGYSDHTDGFEISLAAVALGATIIEKHLTLDRNAEGPDHAASLEPDDFTRMVSAIRNIEGAIGDGIKTPKNSEIRNMPIARKSLVAARPLQAGDCAGRPTTSRASVPAQAARRSNTGL